VKIFLLNRKHVCVEVAKIETRSFRVCIDLSLQKIEPREDAANYVFSHYKFDVIPACLDSPYYYFWRTDVNNTEL
jgi:hypothetical protein